MLFFQFYRKRLLEKSRQSVKVILVSSRVYFTLLKKYVFWSTSFSFTEVGKSLGFYEWKKSRMLISIISIFFICPLVFHLRKFSQAWTRGKKKNLFELCLKHFQDTCITSLSFSMPQAHATGSCLASILLVSGFFEFQISIHLNSILRQYFL